MIRKTITVLSLLSLLLSVGLWIVGGFWSFVYVSSSLRFHIVVEGGAIATFVPEEPYMDASDRNLPPGHVMHTMDSAADEFSPIESSASPGISIERLRQPVWLPYQIFGGRSTTVIPSGFMYLIPFWMVVVGLLVTFSCACGPIKQLRRRKRKKFGLCLRCGYDLRESKERCPECGTGFET